MTTADPKEQDATAMNSYTTLHCLNNTKNKSRNTQTFNIETKEQKYYERAHDYFAQLADYKDSKKQAENMRCETIIAKGTKEINCAISLLNRSRFDKSIEKLETIC